MAYTSRQLFFKFVCVVVLVSLVTFAGVMVSMEQLRAPGKSLNQHESPSPTSHLHFLKQMEQYQACGACTRNEDHYNSGVSNAACCGKRLNRKWGPSPPPATRLVHDANDSKVRISPEAQHNQPFLRRTPGIDYSRKSNATQYTYLTPDPAPYPLEAPEPPFALPPMFFNDYSSHSLNLSRYIPRAPPQPLWIEPPNP